MNSRIKAISFSIWHAVGPLFFLLSTPLIYLFFFYPLSLGWNVGCGFSLLLSGAITLFSCREGNRILAIDREAKAKLESALTESQVQTQKQEALREEREERIKVLLDELNEVRSDKFQLALLQEYPSSAQKNEESQLKQLQDELERLTQVKQQFKEKSEALTQARTEIFNTESQLLHLQKERENQLVDLNPEESALISHLQEVTAECHALEAEVRDLQEIVSQLMHKEKARRTRKSIKPEKQLSIF